MIKIDYESFISDLQDLVLEMDNIPKDQIVGLFNLYGIEMPDEDGILDIDEYEHDESADSW